MRAPLPPPNDGPLQPTAPACEGEHGSQACPRKNYKRAVRHLILCHRGSPPMMLHDTSLLQPRAGSPGQNLRDRLGRKATALRPAVRLPSGHGAKLLLPWSCEARCPPSSHGGTSLGSSWVACPAPSPRSCASQTLTTQGRVARRSLLGWLEIFPGPKAEEKILAWSLLPRTAPRGESMWMCQHPRLTPSTWAPVQLLRPPQGTAV